MPDIPQYPDGDTGYDTEADRNPEGQARKPRPAYRWWIVGAVVVVMFVVLHLTGVVGAGAH
ncbi:MAG: hypothetical protein ACQSGP_21795 [Frankia sp.]